MNQKYKKEHSAGGVVFKKTDDQLLFLIGKHSGYHKWVLPKGLIEPGETPKQTAIRETEEEMGVKTKLLQPGPIHQDTYWYQADFKKETKKEVKDPKKDRSSRRVKKYQESGGKSVKVKKTVDFYLLRYQSGSSENHGWEMSQTKWFSYHKALKKLAFDGEKEALKKAWEIFKKS